MKRNMNKLKSVFCIVLCVFSHVRTKTENKLLKCLAKKSLCILMRACLYSTKSFLEGSKCWIKNVIDGSRLYSSCMINPINSRISSKSCCFLSARAIQWYIGLVFLGNLCIALSYKVTFLFDAWGSLCWDKCSSFDHVFFLSPANACQCIHSVTIRSYFCIKVFCSNGGVDVTPTPRQLVSTLHPAVLYTP